MSTFMFKYLNHDFRLLKFNKPLHFFAEIPLLLIGITCTETLSTINTIRFKPLNL